MIKRYLNIYLFKYDKIGMKSGRECYTYDCSSSHSHARVFIGNVGRGAHPMIKCARKAMVLTLNSTYKIAYIQ